MTATYEPGTVAVATVRGVPNVRVFRTSNEWPWCSPQSVRGTYWHTSPEVTDVRPLVVLDPEDLTADDIKRAVKGWGSGPSDRDRAATRLLRFASRLEAQTRPPKPAEPTGLGAVVEDVEGETWVRTGHARKTWHNAAVLGRAAWAKYDDIDVARIVHEGVPA